MVKTYLRNLKFIVGSVRYYLLRQLEKQDDYNCLLSYLWLKITCIQMTVNR